MNFRPPGAFLGAATNDKLQLGVNQQRGATSRETQEAHKERRPPPSLSLSTDYILTHRHDVDKTSSMESSRFQQEADAILHECSHSPLSQSHV